MLTFNQEKFKRQIVNVSHRNICHHDQNYCQCSIRRNSSVSSMSDWLVFPVVIRKLSCSGSTSFKYDPHAAKYQNHCCHHQILNMSHLVVIRKLSCSGISTSYKYNHQYPAYALVIQQINTLQSMLR